MIFNNKSFGRFLPIKSYLANHPVEFMIWSFVFSILYFGMVIKLVERPAAVALNTEFRSYLNSFYYVMVTMTTIGYGDFVCKALVS